MRYKLLFAMILPVLLLFSNIAVKGQVKAEKAAATDTEQAVEYSFCDVFNKPELFEGKLIKMSVVYQEGLAGGDILLTSDACKNYMGFSFDVDDKSKKRKLNEYLEKKVQFDVENRGYGEARITIIGVLSKNKVEGQIPIKDYLQGYHFYLKDIVIEKTEKSK